MLERSCPAFLRFDIGGDVFLLFLQSVRATRPAEQRPVEAEPQSTSATFGD
jgi:hypothetical protein